MRRWFTDGRWLSTAAADDAGARAQEDPPRRQREPFDPYGPPYPARFTWERLVRDYGIPLRDLRRHRHRSPP